MLCLLESHVKAHTFICYLQLTPKTQKYTTFNVLKYISYNMDKIIIIYIDKLQNEFKSFFLSSLISQTTTSSVRFLFQF